MDGWTPKKLIMASFGVAVLSSALSGGFVVWLMTGKKPPEPAIFSPNAAVTASPQAAPPLGAPPANASALPPTDIVQAGNWYYDRQRWPEAIQAYEKALASGIDNPDVRTDLGNCYRFSNRADDALKQYEIAQKQDASHENSLYNQASLYAEVLKNPTKADEVARQFIAHFPASPNAATVRRFLAAP